MTGVRGTILEMTAVIVVGAAIGLSVNAAADTGLDIGRDHFRRASLPQDGAEDHIGRRGESGGGATDDDGFQLINHEDVFDLHQSESFADERCVFVDARDDAHYADGHIPGAYQLDHYRADRYIGTLLAICTTAEKIVIYCNGGKCEDSKLAAGDLIEQGVDPRKVFIYTGGVTAWKGDGLPFERGERLSEDLVYLDEEED